jgi:hypothetical protein
MRAFLQESARERRPTRCWAVFLYWEENMGFKVGGSPSGPEKPLREFPTLEAAELGANDGERVLVKRYLPQMLTAEQQKSLLDMCREEIVFHLPGADPLVVRLFDCLTRLRSRKIEVRFKKNAP